MEYSYFRFIGAFDICFNGRVHYRSMRKIIRDIRKLSLIFGEHIIILKQYHYTSIYFLKKNLYIKLGLSLPSTRRILTLSMLFSLIASIIYFEVYLRTKSKFLKFSKF